MSTPNRPSGVNVAAAAVQSGRQGHVRWVRAGGEKLLAGALLVSVANSLLGTLANRTRNIRPLAQPRTCS